MITYNMTAGVDNELIWLVRVNLDDVTFRFSDVVGGISLDGNTWDAAVMDWEQWRQTQLDKAIDLTGGGSLGSIGNFEFAIQRYNAFSGLSNYFEDVYPATGARYLTSRTIEIGYVWSGATSESDITWEAKYYIRKFPYTDNKMTLICFEINDLANRDLPYYKVQKDYDNGISYFTNAIKESYDEPIPILYGDFAPTQQGAYLQNYWISGEFLYYAPALIVDKAKMQILVASHKCHTVGNIYGGSNDYYLFRYFPNQDTYMRIHPGTAGTTSGVNSEAGHSFTMQSSGASKLLGELVLQLISLGSESDITEIENATDDDNTTYNEIDAGEKISIMPAGSISDVGTLSSAEGSIQTWFFISSNDANSRNWEIGFYYEKDEIWAQSTTNNTGSTTGTTISGRWHSYGDTNVRTVEGNSVSIPYGASELVSREYYLKNTEVTAGNKIRVYAGYLYWNDINVLSIVRKQKKVKITIQQFGGK